MMPTHVAARELERRRAERSAEFAWQLPLYAEEPFYQDPAERGAEGTLRAPEWTTDY